MWKVLGSPGASQTHAEQDQEPKRGSNDTAGVATGPPFKAIPNLHKPLAAFLVKEKRLFLLRAKADASEARPRLRDVQRVALNSTKLGEEHESRSTCLAGQVRAYKWHI